jgi:hypothetical protein
MLKHKDQYQHIQNFTDSYDSWEQFEEEVSIDDLPPFVIVEGSLYALNEIKIS